MEETFIMGEPKSMPGELGGAFGAGAAGGGGGVVVGGPLPWGSVAAAVGPSGTCRAASHAKQ